jgi:hypothetical protein
VVALSDLPGVQTCNGYQQALALLQVVQGAVASNAHAARHVERAIKELTIALTRN